MMATSVASGAPLPETDLLVAQSRELARSHLRGRDGLASLVLGTAFAVAATALAVLAHSTRPFELWLVVLLVVSYAYASRIDFEIGTGSAVPTQLILVPMLALLPVQYVPLCVLAGLLLGGLPEYLRGRVPFDRSVLRFVNSWHAFGAAFVLVLAGQPAPSPEHFPVW